MNIFGNSLRNLLLAMALMLALPGTVGVFSTAQAEAPPPPPPPPPTACCCPGVDCTQPCTGSGCCLGCPPAGAPPKSGDAPVVYDMLLVSSDASEATWNVRIRNVQNATSLTGVDTSDFVLLGGVSGDPAAILEVTEVCYASPGYKTFAVRASTGTGNGSLQLKLADDDSVADTVTNKPLGGPGAGNGNFVGEVYTIDRGDISVNNASVSEGDSGTTPLNFTLTRSGDTSKAVAVSVETNAGSSNPATAGSDYRAIPAGTKVIIPAGASMVTLPVTLFGDTVVEPDETFFLHLTGAREIAPPSFTKTNYGAGESPYDVKIGDLNGDGKPDLVVANRTTHEVSVLLGTGSGGFAAAVAYGAGSSPRTVAIGDLNGDGKPELVAGSVSGPWILLNNGNGEFSIGDDFTADGGIVTLTDVNTDGRLDMVVAGSPGPNFRVFLNTTTSGVATPTFTDVFNIPAGNDTQSSIAAGDLNGDGRPDLVLGDRYTDSIVVRFNTTASGTTTPSYADPISLSLGNDQRAYAIAIGDLNGDGRPDLAVAYSPEGPSDPLNDPHGVNVLLNNGSGGFDPAVSFAAGAFPFGIALADLNGDGRLDMASANSGSSNASVLINNGEGTFASAVHFAAGTGPRAIASGDFDGNGVADLAVANRFSSNVSVLLAPAPVAVPITTNEGLSTILNDDTSKKSKSGSGGSSSGGGGADLLMLTLLGLLAAGRRLRYGAVLSRISASCPLRARRRRA